MNTQGLTNECRDLIEKIKMIINSHLRNTERVPVVGLTSDEWKLILDEWFIEYTLPYERRFWQGHELQLNPLEYAKIRGEWERGKFFMFDGYRVPIVITGNESSTSSDIVIEIDSDFCRISKKDAQVPYWVARASKGEGGGVVFQTPGGGGIEITPLEAIEFAYGIIGVALTQSLIQKRAEGNQS